MPSGNSSSAINFKSSLYGEVSSDHSSMLTFFHLAQIHCLDFDRLLCSEILSIDRVNRSVLESGLDQ